MLLFEAQSFLSHAGKYFPLAILFYFLASCTYNIFFHPLSKYPGPFLAKLTKLWAAYVLVLSKRGHLNSYELHKRYGPIVRTGPNSLSFNEPNAMKKIYSRGKDMFPRASIFPAVGVNPQHPPVFFSIDSKTHTTARRKVHAVYRNLWDMLQYTSTPFFPRLSFDSDLEWNMLVLESLNARHFNKGRSSTYDNGGSGGSRSDYSTTIRLDRIRSDEEAKAWIEHGEESRGFLVDVGNVNGSDAENRLLVVAQNTLSGMDTWALAQRFASVLSGFQNK